MKGLLIDSLEITAGDSGYCVKVNYRDPKSSRTYFEEHYVADWDQVTNTICDFRPVALTKEEVDRREGVTE